MSANAIGEAFFSNVDDEKVLRQRIRTLPAETRAKIKKLEFAAMERSGVQNAIFKTRDALAEKIRALKAAIAHGEADKEHYGTMWTEDNESHVKAQRAELAELEAEYAELAPKEFSLKDLPREERLRRERLRTFAPPWSVWLPTTPRTARFRHVATALPSRKKSDSLRDMLESAQAASDAAVDELIRVERSALDLESVLAGMRADVAKLAAQGAPKIDALFRYRTVNIRGTKEQGRIEWPTEQIYSASLSDSREIQMGNAMLAWLWRDQLEERLERMICERAGEQGGLSIAEKNAKVKELEAELLQLHRVEEAINCAMEDAGHRVERRQLSPLAILEIEPDETDFG